MGSVEKFVSRKSENISLRNDNCMWNSRSQTKGRLNTCTAGEKQIYYGQKLRGG